VQLALAQSAPEREAEAEAWHKEFMEGDEAKQGEMVKAFLGGLQQGLDKINAKKRAEREKEKAAEEAARKRREKEARRKQEDLTNPRLDVFWSLGEKMESDTGLFVDWCREGHRIRNTFIAYRTAWRRFRTCFPDLERLGGHPARGEGLREEVFAREARWQARAFKGRRHAVPYRLAGHGLDGHQGGLV
jgi:hypothetical protein